MNQCRRTQAARAPEPSRIRDHLGSCRLKFVGASSLILGIAWFFAADAISQTLPLQPGEKIIVPMKLGPHRLNIDRRYLGWGQAMCRDDMCDFWALLPNVEPVTAGNWAEFDSAGPDSRKLFIFLSHASTFRYRTREAKFDEYSHLGWIDPAGEPVQYDLRRHAATTAWLEKEEFYVGQGAYGRFVFFSCSRPGTFPSPQCDVQYPLSSDLQLRYVFKRQYLAYWREIDQKVNRLIESFRE